jgi:hypothetical protein
VTEGALLAVVDAVAWERAMKARRAPPVDLAKTLLALEAPEFEEFVIDARVVPSLLLQQVVGLERMRRSNQIRSWGFVQVTQEGAIRLSVVALAGEKMVVLHA